jgi:hypothetical protein
MMMAMQLPTAMSATVNFGTVQAYSDDQLRRKTLSILMNIHLSESDTGGAHSQIVAEQLLIECKERGMLCDVQEKFETTYDTVLKVGSVLSE